jgi:hypothetical protein
MSEPFHVKLAFVLKVLSVSRGALAAELSVDKSLVGRWVTGTVSPSAHNLARLSAFVASRTGAFSSLDWDRPLANLASFLGVDPQTAPGSEQGAIGMPAFPFAAESRATIARRGGAYEGFYRSTRPYSQIPGGFIHDHMMVRLDGAGNLGVEMTTGGVTVRGWIWLLQTQLFVISAEMTSGAFAYAILNGVNSVKADRLDGLMLTCALDPSRTPVAMPLVVERIEDLSGDPARDDARLAELSKLDPMAPAGSVPPDIVAHLLRPVGLAAIEAGGDWVMSAPIARSVAQGAPVTR